MGISDWPVHQRPRERLIREGARTLSDAELLAVFLRVGVRGKDAIALAYDAVGHFGSVHGLLSANVRDFSAIPGLGVARFAQLQAVLELSRRALAQQMQAGVALNSPHAVK